jgi:tRNA nucleotidyltransferase (CCA-adding enzyme)
MPPPRVVPAPFSLTPREERVLALLRRAAAASDHSGVVLRVAGGWVRNKLLGLPGGDMDVALNNQTGAEFARHLQRFSRKEAVRKGQLASAADVHGVGVIRANPAQSKHLETATALVLGETVDLVNLRSEDYADQSSRIPTMRIGTPLEDALRRDFTVNALFYNVADASVEDFVGSGLDDLAHRTLRTPDEAAALRTMLEDPLRVLRCVRFASALDMTVAPSLAEACAAPSVTAALRGKVSRERVGSELQKLIETSARPSRGLRLIVEFGLVDAVLGSEAAAALPGGFARGVERVSLFEVEPGLADAPHATRTPAMLAALLSPLAEAHGWAGIAAVRAVDAIVKTALKRPARLSAAVSDTLEASRELRTLCSNLAEQQIAAQFDSVVRTLRRAGPDLWRAATLLAALRDPQPLPLDAGRRFQAALVASRAAAVFSERPRVDGNTLMARGLSGPAVGDALHRALCLQLRDPALPEAELVRRALTPAP